MSATDAFRTSIQALLAAIEAQQGFTVQQSRRQGKLYFMWDFIGNTLQLVENGSSNADAKMDAVTRSIFAEALVNDTTGKLTMMTGGDTTQFDRDVKDKAKVGREKAEEWVVAQGVLEG